MGSNTTEFPLAIVSTDTTVLRDISWTLSEFGYQAVISSDWSEHAPWRRLNTPSLQILDARDEQQIETTLAASRSTPYTYQIALYDANLLADPDALMDLGADDLVRYPLNTGELMSCLRRGIRRLEFERRLKFTVTVDLRSGVANRRGFTRQLERKLQEKNPGSDAALVVLGVDFLDIIREQFGLVAAEKACALAAESLYGEYSDEHSRGVLGEGIYAILLQGQSLQEGLLFAEEIASVVSERSANNVFGPRISLSGAVFDWPSADSAEDTIERAIAALEHLRSWGGNQILTASEVEREYSDWMQRFSSRQAINAQHVMEALPLVLPINAANQENGLGIYSFATGPLPPCVPVVDDVGHLVGVVDGDTFQSHGKEVFSALDEHLEPVSATLRGDSRLSDISASLETAEKDYLLVVENKKPIGYVTHETIAALEVKAGNHQKKREFAQADCGLSSLVVPLI